MDKSFCGNKFNDNMTADDNISACLFVLVAPFRLFLVASEWNFSKDKYILGNLENVNIGILLGAFN